MAGILNGNRLIDKINDVSSEKYEFLKHTKIYFI